MAGSHQVWVASTCTPRLMKEPKVPIETLRQLQAQKKQISGAVQGTYARIITIRKHPNKTWGTRRLGVLVVDLLFVAQVVCPSLHSFRRDFGHGHVTPALLASNSSNLASTSAS